jgi:hypothetical protein
MKSMSIVDCLQLLHAGSPVSIRVITADAHRKKGGKVIEYASVVIYRKNPINHTATSTNEVTNSVADSTGRSPNHNKHFTRNLLLPNNTIVKVHPILITHINNIEVL